MSAQPSNATVFVIGVVVGSACYLLARWLFNWFLRR